MKKRSRDDQGGTGWEIVREAAVCKACADQSPPIPIPAEAEDDDRSYAESA